MRVATIQKVWVCQVRREVFVGGESQRCRHADDEPGFVMHHGELTEEEARVLAKATIAKVREQQRTEATELMELLADVVQKATPYGTQDGDFIASYLLPTGPIHRAIAYLKGRGIPTVTGQGSDCAEMELIGGEPVEWCVAHGAAIRANGMCQVAYWTADLSDLAEPDPCRFESQIRVRP